MKAAVFAVSLLGLIGASMPLRAHADEQLVSPGQTHQSLLMKSWRAGLRLVRFLPAPDNEL